jgi:hypothetical protein
LLDKLSVAMRALRRALESDLQHRVAGAVRTDSRAPGLARACVGLMALRAAELRLSACASTRAVSTETYPCVPGH